MLACVSRASHSCAQAGAVWPGRELLPTPPRVAGLQTTLSGGPRTGAQAGSQRPPPHTHTLRAQEAGPGVTSALVWHAHCARRQEPLSQLVASGTFQP